ncbi:MAG: apolipoprotein N-acyltransferase [Desulfocapsaceae bacterium]|nr:apolipoprotein N-acyltransferase [Desulfocapsaceae bacterium]
MMRPFIRQAPLLPALASGLLLCLGMPGTGGLWPLLFIALVPLLTALKAATPGQALRCGLVTGLVHFISLLYWIIIVMGRYGGLGWYISYPTLFLLALILSLFVMAFAVSARILLAGPSPLPALWGLPCIWVGLDWIRSFIFTGFPWMDLGYGLWSVPGLIQLSDLTGHYGITFVLLLTNTLAALILTGREKTLRLPVLAPVAVLLLCLSLYSVWRWQSLDQWMATARTMRIGVVQGNILQNEKWVPEDREKTVMSYLGQTRSLFADNKPALVVWPETALPFYPEYHPGLMAPVWYMVEGSNTGLLTGAPWAEAVETRKFRFYNSAMLLKPDGTLGGRYSKTHLVPFGEYVPMKKFLWFIAPIVQTVGDFTPGTVENPIVFGDARIGVVLCYESIFPDIAEKWAKVGANVLFNLTNDAWYGKSSAPQQSFAMTVFRAVENRRSVVRAANTGISGFIDPLGRVRKRSEIFVPWQAADDVVLNETVPFVVGLGHLFAPLCLAAGAALTLDGRRRRRRLSRET